MKTSTQSGQYDNKRNFEVKTGTQKKISMALYKSMLHEELDCLLSVPHSVKKKITVKLEKEQRNTTRMTKDVGGVTYKQLLNDWGISEWKRDDYKDMSGT